MYEWDDFLQASIQSGGNLLGQSRVFGKAKRGKNPLIARGLWLQGVATLKHVSLFLILSSLKRPWKCLFGIAESRRLLVSVIGQISRLN